MAEIHDLNPTDASNTARFPENMAPSAVNDGARALEGIIARYESDMDFSVEATLSGSVLQMTANRSSLTLTGTTSNYIADLVMAFKVGANPITGPASLNLNGIGPISLRDKRGNSLSSSMLLSGDRVLAIKDDTNDYFRVLMPDVGPPTQLAAFLAYNSATDLSQTGAGTTATVDFDTEVYDYGGNFSADTFTAPVTGIYALQTLVNVQDLSSATSVLLQIVTSNRTYRHNNNSPPDGVKSMMISVIADMDAGDTAIVQCSVSGMAGDTADISGGATLLTYFSGRLVG